MEVTERLGANNINDFIMQVDTDINLRSVILSEENQKKIEQFIREQRYKGEFLKYNLYPINRLLFSGASGCGKTFLSKALANELGYKMLYVDIASTLSDGSVARKLSEVFEYAHKEKQSIIFLDECDSIAWNRESKHAESGDNRRVLNSLFQMIDQMDKDTIVIGATNLLQCLDAAFKRRFDMKLVFDNPSANLLDTIKKFNEDGPNYMIDYKIDSTLRRLVEMRCSVSYYEIKGALERCVKASIVNGESSVSIEKIYRDIANISGIRVAKGDGTYD